MTSDADKITYQSEETVSGVNVAIYNGNDYRTENVNSDCDEISFYDTSCRAVKCFENIDIRKLRSRCSVEIKYPGDTHDEWFW